MQLERPLGWALREAEGGGSSSEAEQRKATDQRRDGAQRADSDERSGGKARGEETTTALILTVPGQTVDSSGSAQSIHGQTRKKKEKKEK